MRTSTAIYTGVEDKIFFDKLRYFFPQGRVAVVFTAGIDVVALEKELTTMGYVVDFYNERTVNKIDEGARYIIGIGKKSVIRKVKSLVEGRSHCFYATECLIEYCLGNQYADFVFFDERKVEKATAYAQLFTFATEFATRLFYESAFPYTSGILRVYLKRLRELLLGQNEEESFVKNAMSLCKECSKYGYENFLSVKCCSDEKDRFIYDYFINTLCIIFTKWDFFDILIPAENISCNKAQTSKRDKSVLFDKEELAIISSRYQAVASVNRFSVKDVLRTIKKRVDGGMIGEINDKGIILGLLQDDKT